MAYGIVESLVMGGNALVGHPALKEKHEALLKIPEKIQEQLKRWKMIGSCSGKRLKWQYMSIDRKVDGFLTTNTRLDLIDAEYIELDCFSNGSNKIECHSTRLGYFKNRTFSLLGQSRKKRLVSKVWKNRPSSPLLAGRLRLYLTDKESEQFDFSEERAIQPEDLAKISKVWSQRIEDGPYKSPKDYDKTVQDLYSALEEFVSGRKKLSSYNPFRKIASSSRTLPSLQKGMVLLPFPEKLLSHLERLLEPELLLLHLTGKGTLVPYYEYPEVPAGESRRLSILFRHRAPKGKKEAKGKKENKCEEETNFCRFTGIFSLDPLTRQALEGVPLEGQTYNAETHASRELILAMFGGMAGLKMPGHKTYRLASDRAVAPVDAPFRGGYEELEDHFERGTAFKASEYTGKGGKVPDEWNTPIKMEPCPEAIPIIKEAYEEIPNINEKVRKTPAFERYRDTYYKTMTNLALIYSNDRIVLTDSLNNTEVKEKVDVRSWEHLMAHEGLPTPDKSFEYYQWRARGKKPNLPGVLQRANQYPPTVDFKRFLNTFADLSLLQSNLASRKNKGKQEMES